MVGELVTRCPRGLVTTGVVVCGYSQRARSDWWSCADIPNALVPIGGRAGVGAGGGRRVRDAAVHHLLLRGLLPDRDHAQEDEVAQGGVAQLLGGGALQLHPPGPGRQRHLSGGGRSSYRGGVRAA
eukprot:1180542-Prorocentrum_minimum.AAC.2